MTLPTLLPATTMNTTPWHGAPILLSSKQAVSQFAAQGTTTNTEPQCSFTLVTTTLFKNIVEEG